MDVIIVISLVLVGLWVYFKFFIGSEKATIENHVSSVPAKIQYQNRMKVFVAGAHVAKRKNYILNNLYEGIEVQLFADPNNKVDSNAIKVEESGFIIGYIPADKTKLVHPLLEIDHKVLICQMDEEDSYTNPGAVHLTVYIEILYN